jgi:hypothetical protein
MIRKKNTIIKEKYCIEKTVEKLMGIRKTPNGKMQEVLAFRHLVITASKIIQGKSWFNFNRKRRLQKDLEIIDKKIIDLIKNSSESLKKRLLNSLSPEFRSILTLKLESIY